MNLDLTYFIYQIKSNLLGTPNHKTITPMSNTRPKHIHTHTSAIGLYTYSQFTCDPMLTT